MIRVKRETLLNKLWHYVKYFSQQTTIHGFNIIGMSKLHYFERIFWVFIISISAAGAISLIISNWTRYAANPTVISIQKDYRNWANHIPAITGCFSNRVDPEKAKRFIYQKWNIKPSYSKYEYYYKFLETVANASYTTFENFEMFKNDPSLMDVDMAQLALQMHPKITGNLVTVDKSREFKLNIVLIEFGICFTFFSKHARILSINRNVNDPNETNFIDVSTLTCHYLNGLCYARFDSDPTNPINYYVHSYIEIPDISFKQYHALGKGSEMEIDYRVVETQYSPDIKYLRPIQRSCRFEDEPLTKNAPIYTISMCQMSCRYHIAMRYCGCKPFFYHFFDGNTCNITGLLCLSKYTEILTQNPQKMDCKCPQTCHFINYVAETPKLTIWETGAYFDQRTTFRWGLLHPTTKYRRDIIFGFGDLIVSIGGTLNLFLGISFISIIEVVFLITEGVSNGITNIIRSKKLKRRILLMQKLQKQRNRVAPIYY